MCVVSNVTGYGRDIWGDDPWRIQPTKVWPQTLPNTNPTAPVFTPEQIQTTTEFLELIEKAKKFDEMNNEPKCEDPVNVKWREDMAKRVTELEAELQDAKKALEEGPQLLNE